MYKYVVILLINVGALMNIIESARILAIFPTFGTSHYYAFETLAQELVKRDHQLVVINSFPQKVKLDGFTDIDVSNHSRRCIGCINLYDLTSIPSGTIYDVIDLYECILDVVNVFEFPDVRQLIKSDTEKFDLVITEMFHTDMFLGFAHKFKAPIIGFTFSTMMPWFNSRFANPDNPSYIPCISSQYHSKMNFFQRLSNSVQTWLSILGHKYLFIPRSEEYARKYFGETLPPLEELAKNATMLLFNSHHSIHGPRPLVPGVIEVGGIHIRPKNEIPKSPRQTDPFFAVVAAASSMSDP